MSVVSAAGIAFPATVPVLIVGAGACGLTAALAAREAGAEEVVVLEREATPFGSTSMSAGLIPASGTRFQRERGVEDSAEQQAADILAKGNGQADPDMVRHVAGLSGKTIEWLADSCGVPFDLVEGFVYPGHSALRMHGPPARSGVELLGCLVRAAMQNGVHLMTGAAVETLFRTDDGGVAGVELARPDGSRERIGCRTLILASCGYGGAPDLVKRHIPEMADALYFGHEANRGDALRWGVALGAQTRHLSGYQGHGSVAHPHGILITWAVITEGGIQVNSKGERFADESQGYSEAAVPVLRQPGGIAWTIYDGRINQIARQFADYCEADAAGALRRSATVPGLEQQIAVPPGSLSRTLDRIAAIVRCEAEDPFGRSFDERSLLRPPYFAVKVTGALFHTQGGLVVDRDGRVLRPDGTHLPNLYAGGGAAVGISGPEASGYLSGNGLLTAVVLGRCAGEHAAAQSSRG